MKILQSPHLVRSHQPILLPDGGVEETLAALQRVLQDSSDRAHEALRHTAILDTLADQHDELRSLFPKISLDVLDEPARWVYYPWRNTLVHLLGPQGFDRLRSDRNRNKLTVDEQQLLRTRSVAVVGLSVGHSVAFTLAQEGLCGHLMLADFDTLELSNLNRIPGSVLDLGLPKTTIVARRIAELDPYLSVHVEPAGLTESTIEDTLDGIDLIIDECDSLDVKFLLRDYARRKRRPVVMHTSDAGLLDVERYDLEPNRPFFHGLVDVTDPSTLAGLSTTDKVPIVMAILEPQHITARMAASLVEIDAAVTTWPQLASDVEMGGAIIGAAIRHWGTGRPLPSGRLRLDLDDALADLDGAYSHVEPSFSQSDRELLEALTRAPSGGNVQPWFFSIDNEEVRCFADPSRSSSMDISQRGTLVALGAALFNAKAVAACQGRLGSTFTPTRPLTEAQRSGGEPICGLRFGDGQAPDLADLSAFIYQRSTDRSLQPSQAIPDTWYSSIEEITERYGATSRLLSGDALDAASDIWAAADRIRFLTRTLHSEMMSELSWPEDDLDVGIDVRSLELAPADNAALELARRYDIMEELASWDGGSRLGDMSRNWLGASAGLLALTAPGPDDGDYVVAGQMLQHLWLASEQQGVSLHPMSPLFLYAHCIEDLEAVTSDRFARQMWELRQRFTELCGLAHDQPLTMTFRVTRADKSVHKSRREPISDRLRH